MELSRMWYRSGMMVGLQRSITNIMTMVVIRLPVNEFWLTSGWWIALNWRCQISWRWLLSDCVSTATWGVWPLIVENKHLNLDHFTTIFASAGLYCWWEICNFGFSFSQDQGSILGAGCEFVSEWNWGSACRFCLSGMVQTLLAIRKKNIRGLWVYHHYILLAYRLVKRIAKEDIIYRGFSTIRFKILSIFHEISPCSNMFINSQAS